MAITLGQQYTVGEKDTTLGQQQYDVREKATRKAKTEAILLLLIHTLFSVLFLQLKKLRWVTQQVSHRPIKCQSRLWSQRGTKVNGSHHGENPLLRPTGIQIANIWRGAGGRRSLVVRGLSVILTLQPKFLNRVRSYVDLHGLRSFRVVCSRPDRHF